MTNDQYHKTLQYARKACGTSVIDKSLEENDADFIIGPGDGPLFNLVRRLCPNYLTNPVF